jgi:hypothetical protein
VSKKSINMKLPYQTLRTLKRYESKNGQQVLIRIRSSLFSDIEIPVYDYVNDERVKVSVEKEHWKKGYITGGKYHISIRDLNLLLAEVESSVKDAAFSLLSQKINPTRENILHLTYYSKEKEIIDNERIRKGDLILREDGGAFESEDDFYEFLEKKNDPEFIEMKRQVGIISKQYLLDYWEDFIFKRAPNSYNLSRSSIVKYIQETGDNCLATDFSSGWMSRYFTHIVENGYLTKRKGKEVRLYYEISTIKKYFKILRSFGKYLFDNEVIEKEDYKRFSLQDKNSKKGSLIKYKPNAFKNNHALYKSEFDHLFNYKFTDKFSELIRDLFIIQTWFGGLRKSDFFDLTDDNITKDAKGNITIEFEQHKTGTKVINPANQNYVLPILKKYNYKLPKLPSQNKYNLRLKKVFKTAGLNRKLKFEYGFSNQEKPTFEYHEMHEMVSNKWARNCAVSILVELDYPDHKIKRFSGHEDEKMLAHYREVHKKDVENMLNDVKPE